MKKFLFATSLLFSAFVFAKNIELETSNKNNCKSVDSVSGRYVEGVASSIGVSEDSLRFKRVETDAIVSSDYGSASCVYIIDSPKGLHACLIPMILKSDEQGATPFAAATGYVPCGKR
jgi:hypothetical protein